MRHTNLGPLLFNIDLVNLFYQCEESDMSSYVDNTAPYSCVRDTQTVNSVNSVIQ